VRYANRADFDAAPTYHVLSAAILSSGGNRNFVHMKVMVDAGDILHSRLRKPFVVAGSSAACSKEGRDSHGKTPAKGNFVSA